MPRTVDTCQHVKGTEQVVTAKFCSDGRRGLSQGMRQESLGADGLELA